MMKQQQQNRSTATTTSNEEEPRQRIPSGAMSSFSSIVHDIGSTRSGSGSNMMVVDMLNVVTSNHPHHRPQHILQSGPIQTIQHNKSDNSLKSSSTRRNNNMITTNSSNSKARTNSSSSSSSSSKSLKELPFKRNRKRSSTTELKKRSSTSSSIGNISSHRTTTATTTTTTINSPWTNNSSSNGTNPMATTTSSFSSKHSLLSSSSTTSARSPSLLSISSASTSSLSSSFSSSNMKLKSNSSNNNSKKKSLRRSISWDIRPPKVIHHRHHNRKQLKQRNSSRHLSSDPSINNNNNNKKKKTPGSNSSSSDYGGSHNSSSQNNDDDDVSMMDCENDDNGGGDDDQRDKVEEEHEDEESNHHQNEAWYTKEDYKSFLKEQFVTVHIMQELRKAGADETDTSLDPETYCERGLENYESKELRNGIDATRKLQKLLVMNEQTRQSFLGMKDDEQIRLMATGLSERSNVKAQLRAALDQCEVETTVKSGTSPLEALLAEQKKKMMKEVIGELHKEQQEDLGMGQNQHHQQTDQSPRHHHLLGPQSNSQGMMPIVDFGGQTRGQRIPVAFNRITNTNSSLPPVSAGAQDTSYLNNRLGSMTMDDCEQSRFHTLISQQNHYNFSTNHAPTGAAAPAMSVPSPFVAIQQQGQQQNQMRRAMSGSPFGYAPNRHATGANSRSAASKFSHRAGSAA
mmetsp:Transcript_34316/g.82666  ORF Transcript_34316/g.82666 Transcript_34316/m.82666 type:complete len:686 (-) Transcript_34316:45-2102(-)